MFVCLLASCGHKLGSWWDQTRTKCSSQVLKACKYAGLVMLVVSGNRDISKWKVKEDHAATRNKSILTILLSACGSRDGKNLSNLSCHLGSVMWNNLTFSMSLNRPTYGGYQSITHYRIWHVNHAKSLKVVSRGVTNGGSWPCPPPPTHTHTHTQTKMGRGAKYKNIYGMGKKGKQN